MGTLRWGCWGPWAHHHDGCLGGVRAGHAGLDAHWCRSPLAPPPWRRPCCACWALIGRDMSPLRQVASTRHRAAWRRRTPRDVPAAPRPQGQPLGGPSASHPPLSLTACSSAARRPPPLAPFPWLLLRMPGSAMVVYRGEGGTHVTLALLPSLCLSSLRGCTIKLAPEVAMAGALPTSWRWCRPPHAAAAPQPSRPITAPCCHCRCCCRCHHL